MKATAKNKIIESNLAKCISYAKILKAKHPRKTMPIKKDSIIIFSSLTCESGRPLGASCAHYHPPSDKGVGCCCYTCNLFRRPKICIKRKFLANPIGDFDYMCERYNDRNNPLLASYPNKVHGDAALKIIIAHEMAHHLTCHHHGLVWRKKYHLFLKALFNI